MSPSLEWSGVLFYDVEGSFEDSNLVLTCRDILVLDQGGAVETEIDLNTTDVAAYLAQNLELLDCYQGLIHSHHSMATFFSGTDQNALSQEGSSMNNFLSLIVNNEGKYTAGITRYVNRKKHSTIHTEEWKTYNFFDKETVSLDKKEYDSEENTEDKVVEWCKCIIEKQSAAQLDNVVYQFQKVKEKKDKVKLAWKTENVGVAKPAYKDFSYERKPVKQMTLFGDPEDEYDYQIEVDRANWNKDLVNNLCITILSGTPLITEINLKDLCKNWDYLVSKSFPNDNAFESWLDTWSNYIVSEDPTFQELSEGLLIGDPDEEMGVVCTKIQNELEKLLPKSSHKDALISCFDFYK